MSCTNHHLVLLALAVATVRSSTNESSGVSHELASPAAAAQQDWARRLDGSDAAAARAELVALGAKAVEPLLAVLASGTDAASFQAALAFAALGKDGKKGFESLAARGADSGLARARRVHAVLALGGAEAEAKKLVRALLPLLLAEQEPELALATALTLSQLGKEAAQPLTSALATAPEPVALRAATVLFQLGERGVPAVKDLATLVEDRGNGARGIAATVALGEIGARAERALENAARKRGGGTGGPPIPLPNPAPGVDVISFLNGTHESSQPELVRLERAALVFPAQFPDLDNDTYMSRGELAVGWSIELSAAQALLAADFLSARLDTHATWAKRAEPIVNADRWRCVLQAP